MDNEGTLEKQGIREEPTEEGKAAHNEHQRQQAREDEAADRKEKPPPGRTFTIALAPCGRHGEGGGCGHTCRRGGQGIGGGRHGVVYRGVYPRVNETALT